eukprot:12031427-Alexandrium_andersonii.AAC.1
MLRLRRHLLARFALAHWRPRAALVAAQLPRPYLAHKGKCPRTAHPGLRCRRDHAREREIVAGPDHPAKGWLRACARA